MGVEITGTSAGSARLLRAAAGWPGNNDSDDLEVAGIRRHGRVAAIVFRPDQAEIARRAGAGQPAITDLATLDALLNLPLDLPVPRDGLHVRERAALRRLPPGAIESDPAGQIVRRTRPPLLVVLALVSVNTWETGIRAAAEYNQYCRCAMLLPGEPAELDAMLQASFYGVGVGVAARNADVRELLPPGPFTRRAMNPAHWAFAEHVYTRLDTYRPPEPHGQLVLGDELE